MKKMGIWVFLGLLCSGSAYAGSSIVQFDKGGGMTQLPNAAIAATICLPGSVNRFDGAYVKFSAMNTAGRRIVSVYLKSGQGNGPYASGKLSGLSKGDFQVVDKTTFDSVPFDANDEFGAKINFSDGSSSAAPNSPSEGCYDFVINGA